MSELIQKSDNRATIRWKLLTGASALALTAYVSSAAMAKAEDASQPQVWIELSGQLSRLQDGQETFAPPFVALTPSIFAFPQKYERPPLFSLGESAALTFQPKDSDWIFSASIQYGRASSSKHVRHQTSPSPYQKYGIKSGGRIKQGLVQPLAARFADTRSKQTEDHAIIDFQAGKDVGVGLFGPDASSSVSVGVRLAQFTSKSRASLSEDPDWKFNPALYTLVPYFPPTQYFEVLRQAYHTYAGSFSADRSFHGLGPSVSWKSSVPFAGNSHDGELTLDWGVNAAVLFGRQRTKIHRKTTSQFHNYQTLYYYRFYPSYNYAQRTTHDNTPPDKIRSRRVTVPNVGGFAGISFNYADAKISFGYKADFFFGAIDGGIDVAKKENRAFYGPYASISIGIGD